MKIDAIVPVYNEEKNVANVVNTLLESSLFKDIICVNDGSSDNSQTILKSFGNKIKLVSYSKNKGKGNALAEGVKQATAEIVHFTDADIIGLNKKNLHSMIAPVLAKECDVVLGTKGDNMLLISRKASAAITGQRTYLRKDLLPLLKTMRTKRFGVELFLNDRLRGKKTVVLHIEDSYHLRKHQKSKNFVESVREQIKEGYEISKELGTIKSDKVKEYISKTSDNLKKY